MSNTDERTCPLAPDPKPGDLDVERVLSRNHLMRLHRSGSDREVWHCARGCGRIEIRQNPFTKSTATFTQMCDRLAEVHVGSSPKRCPWCGAELESFTPPPPTGLWAEVSKHLHRAAHNAGVTPPGYKSLRCTKDGCGYMCAIPEDDADYGPPRPTGNPANPVTLTGMLIPWDGTEPVLLRIPESDLLYLPCFSTKDKLDSLMSRAGISFAGIKRIDDGDDFLAGILESSTAVRIIADPYFLPNGRVRYVELQLSDG